MTMQDHSRAGGGRWHAGDLVEVRSAEEILATLNGDAELDRLPFMPEMLQHCGRRFRISRSAHKTCTYKSGHFRTLDDAVHLEDLRCDGSGHDGCQAACLLFWKSAWLKPVTDPDPGTGPDAVAPPAGHPLHDTGVLAAATRRGGGCYSCQATRLPEATRAVDWWNPVPYLKDLRTGNVGFLTFVRFVALAAAQAVIRRLRRDPSYPAVAGLATAPQPATTLDLKPGELVQIRSRDEIMHTIDGKRKNHNLWFDVEMEPYCGGTYRVRQRVQRLIDEKTGRMLKVKRDCIILEGVVCSGCRSRDRLFCSRAIFPYWREAWLKRVT
jgi:hypothetical protein